MESDLEAILPDLPQCRQMPKLLNNLETTDLCYLCIWSDYGCQDQTVSKRSYQLELPIS